jgi:ABC-2 type transport system permease protein
MTSVRHAERGLRTSTSELAAALASEVDKLRSWPAARWLVALALLLAAAGSAAFVASAPVTAGQELGALTERDRLTISLLGLDLANLTLVVVAVLFVSTEASSGQLALTLLATPRRRVVFAAKVLVLLALSVVVGVLATATALGAGQLVLLAHGLSLPGHGAPGVQAARLVTVTALMIPLHVVFGAALAFCFRSAGVALTGVFVIMCLPSLARLLPGELAAAAQWLLPAPSLHTLSGASLPGDPDYTQPWTAAAVLAVWVAVLLGVAYRTFRRRDY